jgi:hypothetical protein
MAEIELTDAQRQALQAERGKPVAVVDPATQQRFVLLAREQYERVRSLLEGAPEKPPPAPVLPPGPSEGKEEPRRVRLRDLPTPPEVVEEMKRWRRKHGWGWGWGWKAHRQAAEEQFMLQYYFGGQEVFVLPTPEGTVVVPIPECYKDAYDLRSILFTPEERPHACMTVPEPWDDTVHQILSS